VGYHREGSCVDKGDRTQELAETEHSGLSYCGLP
jgi:hypothetical protein